MTVHDSHIPSPANTNVMYPATCRRLLLTGVMRYADATKISVMTTRPKISV